MADIMKGIARYAGSGRKTGSDATAYERTDDRVVARSNGKFDAQDTTCILSFMNDPLLRGNPV